MTLVVSFEVCVEQKASSAPPFILAWSTYDASSRGSVSTKIDSGIYVIHWSELQTSRYVVNILELTESEHLSIPFVNLN